MRSSLIGSDQDKIDTISHQSGMSTTSSLVGLGSRSTYHELQKFIKLITRMTEENVDIR